MNEAETRAEHIDPALKAAGWGVIEGSRIRREYVPVIDGQPSPYFGEYPPDFFDFIVIDECHRGGANDESNWRGIMDYFSPAVQLGLTATPKRQENADTYRYFGEPVYIYSLKEGINDGYLTPFRVKQIATTGYPIRPSSGRVGLFYPLSTVLIT
jgi:type I site-specific restriction endonuclease